MFLEIKITHSDCFFQINFTKCFNQFLITDSLHHHVHFGEEVDNFGKDNEIGYEYTSSDKSSKLTVHLGFLQIRHLYRYIYLIK